MRIVYDIGKDDQVCGGGEEGRSTVTFVVGDSGNESVFELEGSPGDMVKLLKGAWNVAQLLNGAKKKGKG